MSGEDLNNNALYRKIERQEFNPHQYMDRPTLNHLINHRPQIYVPPSENVWIAEMIPKIQYEIPRFIPKPDWYLIAEEHDTIHGMRHLLRTIILSSLLAHHFRYSQRDREKAMIAAAMHDLRRENDLFDKGHAARAADWFANNCSEIIHHFGISLTAEDCEDIKFRVLFHDTPYRRIFQKHPDIIAQYQKYQLGVDLLKTADASDRFRLPSPAFWFKSDLVVLQPPAGILDFAFELMAVSESSFLDGDSAEDSVLNALTTLFG
jgi:hypothetical protein